MTDVFDAASELEEKQRQAAIAQALASGRRFASPAPCGACLNCDEPLPLGELYCDVDCRDDYNKRNRR